MQRSPEQIKDKLLRALDNDYNVVDMGSVVEVISMLENYPITIQALEQTRLGRYVNDLRKKTANEDLAKRIKKLVRSWQKLIAPESGGGAVNGSDRLSQLQQSGSRNTSPALLSHSPALRAAGLPTRPITPSGYSRPATPAGVRPLTPSGGRPLTPSNRSLNAGTLGSRPPSTGRQVTPSGRPLTPSGLSGKLSTPTSRAATPSSARNQLTVPSTRTNSVSPLAAGSASSYKQGSYARSQVSPAASRPIHSTPVSSKSANNNNASQTVSKTNAANRKRIRQDSYGEPGPIKRPALDNESGVKYSEMVNGLDGNSQTDRGAILKRTASQTSLASNLSSVSSNRNRNGNSAKKKAPIESAKMTPGVSKTPKVKTTAQILAEMQAKNSSATLQSETIARITSNRITKERDPINASIVPAGARPRPRKKPGGPLQPPTPDISRKELVENYLNSFCGDPDDNSYRSESPLMPASRNESPVLGQSTNQNSSGSTYRITNACNLNPEPPDKPDLKKIVKRIPIDEELEQIYSRLPPLDLDSIQWEEDDEEEEPEECDVAAVKPEVTKVDVNKLHSEEWTGMNGMRDSRGDWQDWTNTFSLSSFNDDLLHVLPYVDIDG